MKRWLTHLLISSYLLALFWGIASHTLSFGTASHPSMYFIVWDMFCGWSSYADRIQIVGEGESGKYYELAPGPWGEFKPFASIGRRHYDVRGDFAPRFALNTLKHTRHEPMTRIFVVQECWAKKYNLPDHLWEKRYDEPKDIQKYYHVRHVVTPAGEILKSDLTWLEKQYLLSLNNNPRLKADSYRGRSFLAPTTISRTYRGGQSGSFTNWPAPSPAGSALGN